MQITSERVKFRGRTAIGRQKVSRPVSLALRDRIITSEKTVLDYGCGRGTDVFQLNSMGISAEGWDPNFFPKNQKKSAHVVNLGYVVNVIEDPLERVSVLKDAYSLANECLIVSAQTDATAPSKGVPFSDGILTTRNTFQKYFATESLRTLIEQSTGARAFLIERGIFYVFKSEEARARYFLARERVKADQRHQSKLRVLTQEIENHKEDALLALVAHRYRGTDLLDDSSVSVTACEADFGSVNNAIQTADNLLKIIGDRTALSSSIKSAPCGKTLPDSFYFHSSALQSMPLQIRVLVHCAFTLIDNPGEDFLIKVLKTAESVSVLRYRDFLSAPHPELQQSLVIDLKQKTIKTRNYSASTNPPILHRKETFVLPSFPRYGEFQLLTQKEEELGLLSRSDIGFKQNWEAVLNQIGFDPKWYASFLSANSATSSHPN